MSRLGAARLCLLAAAWVAGPAPVSAQGRKFTLQLRDLSYTEVVPLRTLSDVSSTACAILCLLQSACEGVQHTDTGGECALLGHVPAGAATAAAAGASTYLAGCPDGWFAAPGACFLYVSSEVAVWSDVPARCAAIHPGASIAALRTVEQIAVIRQQLADVPEHFSVGVQRAADGTWQLLDGSPAPELPWAAGQPGASEICTGLFTPDLTMHDTSCGAMAFLCGLEF
ncbi:C-type lectin galactose-binding isoform [Amphibalanus amphitrite]|uniref:C-type lectin galactose-binding isoform n=1 Tax=Amphibalanus amphitrite TaxID=1232801 RepID=A0A6A4X4L7_AMPAM|nr:C-type lectin galactose-binding isoform [Amphibalanus amphitrite]